MNTPKEPSRQDWYWYHSRGHLKSLDRISPRELAMADRLFAHAEATPDEHGELLNELRAFYARLRAHRRATGLPARPRQYRNDTTSTGVAEPKKSLNKPRTQGKKVFYR